MGFQFSALQEVFLDEINEELNKGIHAGSSLFTEDDIEHLPFPVKEYIRRGGYIGKSKMTNARVVWKEVFFRRGPKDKWLPLECYQFNSSIGPARIVYMKSMLAGFLPFEGRDKFQNGRGNMLIKLLKYFTVANDSGPEMDRSALLTLLAETLIIPAQALRNYIEWFPVDNHSAKAVIKWGDIEASGIFEFNDDFEFTRFFTHERYQSLGNNEYKQIDWAGVTEGFTVKNGIKFPARFKGVWYQDGEAFEYFKGTIDNIIYDIGEFTI